VQTGGGNGRISGLGKRGTEPYRKGRNLRRSLAETIFRRTVVFPVLFYKKSVSHVMKPRCIYYPSCSEYFEQAVMKYGVAKGSLKGCYRILRCHPFATGGYDPP
jgi:hypothetical protein